LVWGGIAILGHADSDRLAGIQGVGFDRLTVEPQPAHFERVASHVNTAKQCDVSCHEYLSFFQKAILFIPVFHASA
jgi:hypothetical protein